MSKFKQPTPPFATTAGATTVIAFPGDSGLSIKQREAELEAFIRAADEELRLRKRYRMLLLTLDEVEGLEPVPDDWRARLATRDAPQDDDPDDDEDDDLDL